MNERELFYDDGASSGLWRCGACRRIRLTQSTAASCCVCACGKKIDCGEGMCAQCYEQEIKDRGDRLACGMDVLDINNIPADSVLYFDHGGYCTTDVVQADEYARAYFNEPGVVIPEFIIGWICESRGIINVSSTDQLIPNTESLAGVPADADWYEKIVGKAELDAAIRKFNFINRNLVCAHTNHKQGVVFRVKDYINNETVHNA